MYKKSTIATGILLCCTSVAAVPVLANPLTSAPVEPMQGRLLSSTLTLPGALQSRFYAQRDYLPAWTETAQLEALLEALDELRHDGLNPADYGWLELQALLEDDSLEGLIQREHLATRAYLQALSDLRFGRLNAQEVEPLWHHQSRDPALEQDSLLQLSVAHLHDPRAAFEQARPDFLPYRQLRTAYMLLQQEIDSLDWQPLVSGPLLRPGQFDAERVPVLRSRLLPQQPAPMQPSLYDETLVAAVRVFQQEHALNPDGIVGPATTRAFNYSPSDRLDQVRINLERLRWLAQEYEPHMLLVDIAGGRIDYYRDGESVWQTRSQVGRSSRPTPQIKSRITHFTFNPTWTVPPTILRQDALPEIRRDLSYLERNRMRVLDTQGNRLDPESIDWSNPGAIMLRQDAGPGNALGRVAIRFPNPGAIYLHDTPSQRLFERDQRAFSSGCVRVEHALDLVALLAADGQLQSHRSVDELVASGRTQNISLDHPIPVLLAYWTASADEEGTVIFRPDIYNQDAKLLQALKQSSHQQRDALLGQRH